MKKYIRASKDYDYTSQVSFDFLYDKNYDENNIRNTISNILSSLGLQFVRIYFDDDVDYSDVPEYSDSLVSQCYVDFEHYGQFNNWEQVEHNIITSIDALGYEIIGFSFVGEPICVFEPEILPTHPICNATGIIDFLTIENWQYPVYLTIGLKYRNPTIEDKMLSSDEAIEWVKRNRNEYALLELEGYKGNLHLNAYTANDMW